MTQMKQAAVALAVAAAYSASLFAAPITLRASRQFPGGRGDVRDEMVQIIAREAKAANAELEVQVYPGASLFKPNELMPPPGFRTRDGRGENPLGDRRAGGDQRVDLAA